MNRTLAQQGGMQSVHTRRAGAWVATVFAAAPPLAWTGLILLLASLPTLLMVLLDPRLLYGASVWTKPWKFQLSTGIYLWTLAWVLAWMPAARRNGWLARSLMGVAIGCAVFEVAYITWQAAGGRASHFNVATPFDATMYALMGVGAVLLTSTSLVLGVMVLRSRRFALTEDLRQAIGWGLVLTFVLGTGFGAYLSAQPGHWVAALPSDAQGMLFTGWSRSGGDLRVAHFFGIHAVHILVPWVWLVGRARQWLVFGPAPGRASVSRGFVWASAGFYSLLALWTFAQALQGRPFLA